MNKIYPIIAGLILSFGIFTIVTSAPNAIYQRTILPVTGSAFEIGTSTRTWANVFTDQLCLGGTCRTSWTGTNDWGRFLNRWGVASLSPSSTYAVDIDNSLFADIITAPSSTIGRMTVTSSLNYNGNATSSFGNGISISSGCFRGLDGVCLVNYSPSASTNDWGTWGSYYGNALTTSSSVPIHSLSTLSVSSSLFTSEDVTVGRILYVNQMSGLSAIPYNGSSAQMLQYTASGTAKWITLSSDASIADNGAMTVADDSHDHTATTISGLSTADFTSANISQWTNNSGFISNSLLNTSLFVGNGLVTSTLGANYLAIATSTTDMVGKFYVDSSGNVSASGTLSVAGVNSIIISNATIGNATIGTLISSSTITASALTVGISTAGFMTVSSTLTVSGAITGSSTLGSVFVSSTLKIPNSSDPTINSLGQVAINTTVASTSFRYHDGTAERSLSPLKPSCYSISSTTAKARMGLNTTSTYEIGVALLSPETWTIGSCYANGGTGTMGGVDLGDGVNFMNHLQCMTNSTSTRNTFTTNNTFVLGEGLVAKARLNSDVQEITFCVVRRFDAD